MQKPDASAPNLSPATTLCSMTGSGSATEQADIGQVTVTVSAVNNRGCRVSVRSDARDLVAEDEIRRTVQAQLQRGSINVHISCEPAKQVSFDRQRLIESYRELQSIATEAGAPLPSLQDAMRFVGTGSAATDAAAQWQPVIAAAIEQAVNACQAMRQREGAALADAFAEFHGELFALKTRLAQLAAPRVQAYAERLQERLSEVLADRADITPEHLVRELAVYADRIDVTEELVRLDSHLELLGEILGSSEVNKGKRIEFILQEIGREINTTGAKANEAELQRVVIDAKHVLESMKEQAANVL